MGLGILLKKQRKICYSKVKLQSRQFYSVKKWECLRKKRVKDFSGLVNFDIRRC